MRKLIKRRIKGDKYGFSLYDIWNMINIFFFCLFKLEVIFLSGWGPPKKVLSIDEIERVYSNKRYRYVHDSIPPPSLSSNFSLKINFKKN